MREEDKDFVTDLQRQIKDVLYDRPTKASKEYFVGKMIHVDGVPQKISDQQATAIYRYLLKNDYIDDNEHITEQYRADLENNALAPLAEELKTMTEGIHKLIQSIFNDKILEDMIGNGNETTVPSNDLNENFAKKEFQTLWNYINHKYAYTVDFDSNELIKKAIEHIDRELFVSQLQYTVSKSEQRDVMDAMMVRESNSFYEAKSSTTILKHSETSQITIIGKLIPQENMKALSAPDLFMLIISVFLHDIGMAPDEKYILAWKNQLPEEEYDEELKEEREKFSRFRLTYTHQLADIERLIAEKEFSKAQLLEDYIVTEYIRTTHSIRAREIIATYWAGKIVYQDTDLTEDLATICYSHNESYTYLLQMESFRVCGQDEYLCIPFVATILRLADIIDFDPKRTPSVLFSHLAVKNPVSLNEWKKHQSINAWTISPKRILFSAQCEHPAIEATILAFCNQIDEELRNGTVILSNLSDDGMGINMETYKIPLPPQVDRRKIQAKKDIISGKPIYRYHDTKFSLSKKQIIDLLMGTKLYGKPEVALRELLQNSIDACLLRQKLSELWGIEYTPKVKVSLYTKNNVDYLQVSDNGVGMNQHIIDNYYTNIGCSYYSSREFSDLMVSFKSSFTPISRFGIGILSCFMVCDSMEVTTRRIRERFECDEALHVSIEGYESLFVISDSDKKDPGTDTILTLRPVHPWDRMDEDEFVQCIKGIVPNPAVQIEIETDKRSESYSSDYFDDLDLSPLLDYSWNNTKNIRKIDIDLTCEEYGFKGRGCIGILIKNDMPVEEIEILSKDVEIDGEIYTLSSSVKYKNNCITETSTSISVDEDGEIDTNTSWSERFKSKSSLSIHGIEVPYNLFPNYSNKMSKAVLNILFPFSFRLDIGVNSDLNLNSARDQIIYDEKWLTFEENLYQVICKRLKEQLSLSDWERLNEIIQKNGKNIFSRVANNIE
ncbi:ATP-binding protein [Dorea formicigenerans]|uniref:HD domain-containing protein n=1 Tax=Dorea formicigenerans TaxID=39486 RepID=UPI0022DF8B91|nr:ATP-binding protein [Dorea formicigenerans]